MRSSVKVYLFVCFIVEYGKVITADLFESFFQFFQPSCRICYIRCNISAVFEQQIVTDILIRSEYPDPTRILKDSVSLVLF